MAHVAARTCPGAASLLQVDEARFQAQIVELATALHWWTYHPWSSRHSQSGWPDLVLAKPPRFVLAELKREREHLRPDQRAVIELLRACGLDVRVWRPSDWPEVERLLLGKEAD